MCHHQFHLSILLSRQNEGEEIYFKASHIDPGAADKHVYYWNFDGNKTNGPFNSYQNSHSITNTFNDDGLFTIFSIAQDDDNDSDTIYHQIKINNLPNYRRNSAF